VNGDLPISISFDSFSVRYNFFVTNDEKLRMTILRWILASRRPEESRFAPGDLFK